MITVLFSVSVTICVWVWVCVNECEWMSVNVHIPHGGQRTTWDLFPLLSFHHVSSGDENQVSRPENRVLDLLSCFARPCVILTSFIHRIMLLGSNKVECNVYKNMLCVLLLSNLLAHFWISVKLIWILISVTVTVRSIWEITSPA